jgi:hypothetical protein
MVDQGILDAWFWIFCPKHNGSCLLKGDILGLTVEPIDPFDITLA